MASVAESSKRNSPRPTNFLSAGLLFLMLCDVTTLTSACKSWEQCLTISECRKMQKKNNIQVGRVSDFTFVFPCDESSKVMTICCAIKQPGEQVFEQHPGYNITYGEPVESESAPVAVSQSLPVPLPLKDSTGGQKRSPGADCCGLFLRGGDGGDDATKGQFPWLTLIGKRDNVTGEFIVDCGGSLINNQYVLTSAYCLDNLKATPDTVILGEFDRSLENSQSSGFPQYFNIDKIIVHENFNIPLLKNDIALVRLKYCVHQFSDWLHPVCLPEAPSSESVEYIMAGWRTHGSRGVPPSTIPKFGPLSSKNSGLCDLSIPLQPLAETQMCFGSNPSSCFGDFGGPLIEIIKIGEKERAVLVALYSYGGAQCNAKFSADLYTKIFPFRDWIVKNIGD